MATAGNDTFGWEGKKRCYLSVHTTCPSVIRFIRIIDQCSVRRGGIVFKYKNRGRITRICHESNSLDTSGFVVDYCQETYYGVTPEADSGTLRPKSRRWFPIGWDRFPKWACRIHSQI